MGVLRMRALLSGAYSRAPDLSSTGPGMNPTLGNSNLGQLPRQVRCTSSPPNLG